MPHTPGTWMAQDANLGNINIIGPNGEYICMLPFETHSRKEEMLSNALLIASAPQLPKLLEVLENVEANCEKNNMPCPICLQRATQGHIDECALDQAIREARGE